MVRMRKDSKTSSLEHHLRMRYKGSFTLNHLQENLLRT